MRTLKKVTIIFTLLLTLIGLGGCTVQYANEPTEQDKMVEIVKKNKDEVEDYIKVDDKYNKIKSIEINYDEIRHNPMGGIDVGGTVNGNKKFTFNTTLDKDSDKDSKTYNEIIGTGGTESGELDNFLSTNS